MSCVQLPAVDLPELPGFAIAPPPIPSPPEIPKPFPCCQLPDPGFPPLPPEIQEAIDFFMQGIALDPTGTGINVVIAAMELVMNAAITYLNTRKLPCPKNT